MKQSYSHPLDRLINDNSLIMLESIIPFVDIKTKKFLIIFIKYKEFTILMNALNDINYLTSCGFNTSNCSNDEILVNVMKNMPGDISSSVNDMQKMMGIFNAMNSSDIQPEPKESNAADTQPQTYIDNSEITSDNLYENILNILDEEST